MDDFPNPKGQLTTLDYNSRIVYYMVYQKRNFYIVYRIIYRMI